MSTKPFEFETALKELEEITQWFESSDVDLDRGLEKFERGMELANQLKTHLAGVENRVEKIKQRFSGAQASVALNQAIGDERSEELTPPESLENHDQTDLFGS